MKLKINGIGEENRLLKLLFLQKAAHFTKRHLLPAFWKRRGVKVMPKKPDNTNLKFKLAATFMVVSFPVQEIRDRLIDWYKIRRLLVVFPQNDLQTIELLSFIILVSRRFCSAWMKKLAWCFVWKVFSRSIWSIDFAWQRDNGIKILAKLTLVHSSIWTKKTLLITTCCWNTTVGVL